MAELKFARQELSRTSSKHQRRADRSLVLSHNTNRYNACKLTDNLNSLHSFLGKSKPSNGLKTELKDELQDVFMQVQQDGYASKDELTQAAETSCLELTKFLSGLPTATLFSWTLLKTCLSEGIQLNDIVLLKPNPNILKCLKRIFESAIEVTKLMQGDEVRSVLLYNMANVDSVFSTFTRYPVSPPDESFSTFEEFCTHVVRETGNVEGSINSRSSNCTSLRDEFEARDTQCIGLLPWKLIQTICQNHRVNLGKIDQRFLKSWPCPSSVSYYHLLSIYFKQDLSRLSYDKNSINAAIRECSKKDTLPKSGTVSSRFDAYHAFLNLKSLSPSQIRAILRKGEMYPGGKISWTQVWS